MTDNLRTLIERMVEMRREACRLQASTTHGTPLFLALDEMMAGCDDFLNAIEDQAGVEPTPALLAAA